MTHNGVTLITTAKQFGTGALGAKMLARAIGVTEAQASKMLSTYSDALREHGLNESFVNPPGPTDAAAAADNASTIAAAQGFDMHQRALSDKLAAQVVRAASKPITKASTQDLEALAAMGWR